MTRFFFLSLISTLIACSGTEGDDVEGCEDCPSTTDDTGDPPVSDGYLEAVYSFEDEQLACKVGEDDNVLGDTIVGEQPEAECLKDLGIPVEPGSHNLHFGAGALTSDNLPTHYIDSGVWAGYTVVSPEVEIDIAEDECKLVEASANAYPVGTTISCQCSDVEDPFVESLEYTDGHLLSLPGVGNVNVDGILVDSDEDGVRVEGTFTGPKTIEGEYFFGAATVTFVCTVE